MLAPVTMPSRSTTAIATGAAAKTERYDGDAGDAGDGGGGDSVPGDVTISLSVTIGRSSSVAGAGPSDVPLTARSRSALDLFVQGSNRKVCRS
ncbi:hypothetical protein GCM10010340_33140 [Streptomyces griseoloalbus]|nr:hypothetical protein GCM10010294_01790 [Streptomyces griseoloalbus]GGW52012.1 hypothetical protein GCM10010340_33140 [Streptomyces albaduncus]